MDDALLVRGLERLGDLPRDRQRFVERDRPVRDPLGERRALDQLHHQRVDAAAVFEAVDVRDVRMVERGEHLRFALEPREPLGVVGEQLRQDLDRDVAIQPGVARAIDLAHPAGAKGGEDFVRAEASPGGQGHARPVILVGAGVAATCSTRCGVVERADARSFSFAAK